MPKRLYLARHGETDANLFKIIEGAKYLSYEYGSALNRNGLSQAYELGLALSEIKIHHIYTSPTRRTIETVRQIRHHLANYNDMPSNIISEDLAEIDFGILEGLNGQNAREKFPDLFKIHHEKPSQTVFPLGEKIVEAYQRVSRAIDKIFATHSFDENILIVSHGGVMALIFIKIFKLDLDTMFHAIRHHNCGLSIIEWEKPDFPRIVCVNDISHLRSEHLRMIKEPILPFLSN